MFITPAYAQTASAGAAFDPTFFLPLVLIVVVFYFMLIRPQQKKMKEHRNIISALRRGDKVVTAGGIIGTVSKVVSDNEIELQIADNVRVRVVRNTVTDVLTKPEPASGDSDGGKD